MVIRMAFILPNEQNLKEGSSTSFICLHRPTVLTEFTLNGIRSETYFTKQCFILITIHLFLCQVGSTHFISPSNGLELYKYTNDEDSEVSQILSLTGIKSPKVPIY